MGRGWSEKGERREGVSNALIRSGGCNVLMQTQFIKGIVSPDFGGLQMILMDRIGVPDVPLKDFIFSNSCFLIVF